MTCHVLRIRTQCTTMDLRKYLKRKDELESNESEAGCSPPSEESQRKKQCVEVEETSSQKKRSFTKLNSRTRKIGKQNIHGCTAIMLVRACSVAYAKDGESFLQDLEVHGQPEESQTGTTLLSF